jgi:mRNA interferase YafQ
MRTIEKSKQFRKDYKRCSKSLDPALLDERLKDVLRCLVAGKPLPEQYRDHQLRANWKGCRDCHVFPDLVLIYQFDGDSVLRLVRLGTHSELSL